MRTLIILIKFNNIITSISDYVNSVKLIRLDHHSSNHKAVLLVSPKENYSPEYPGAVSLFVYETSKKSKYKKKIVVFGNTKYKKKFSIKYFNINLKILSAFQYIDSWSNVFPG